MVDRDKLIKSIKNIFGRDLLAKAARVDLKNANGVQFLGQKKVDKLVLGVSAEASFFQKAKEFGAQFIITHHGLRLGEVKTKIPVTLQKRLQLLFELKATLMGFHFSLDHHPRLGNNAQIIKLLGAKRTEENFYDEWGWVGEYEQEKELDWFLERCQKVFRDKPKFFRYGKPKIKRIAVVSGGGAPYSYSKAVWDWQEKKVDLYLTGEAKEPTQAICQESEINYAYVGHYNSEVFGVKALGEEIKKKFPSLKVKFLDIPNPL